MWGRQRSSRLAKECKRNTPTHVGKTIKEGFDGNIAGKHPHACGEDSAVKKMFCAMTETPPRMWGRHLETDPAWMMFGNTPTHVGKTHLHTSHTQPRQKHPHACGEDSRKSTPTTGCVETPPRMWGRRAEAFPSLSTKGNTPTHVGKTSLGVVASGVSGKHPHACGEDLS